MIQPNELRIGNILVEDGDQGKRFVAVTDITRPSGVHYYIHHKFGKDMVCDDMVLDPVALTPELLIKCGFEKTNTPFFEIDMRQNIGQILINPDNGTVWLKHHRVPGFSMNPTSCHHLHQLQNLYFALTGTELKIDLT